MVLIHNFTKTNRLKHHRRCPLKMSLAPVLAVFVIFYGNSATSAQNDLSTARRVGPSGPNRRSPVENSYPIINTTSGAVRGETLLLPDGTPFQQFLSVRYAEPPVNELRYRAPQPAKRRDGIHDGTHNVKRPTACPQPIGLTNRLIPPNAPYRLEPLPAHALDEDCLHCLIYRPVIAQYTPRRLLPMLMYIHGGSFLTGSNSNEIFNGSRLAVETNTIVAVCNYRMGIFGFLKLDVPGITGNQALQDQALAIKFIRDNAEQLGGNRRMITVFGESAGGASVHYQLLSRKSRDVFTRGAAFSGTAFASWSFAPPESAKQNWRSCVNSSMGANLNSTNDDQKLFDFLQKKPWQEINDVIFRLQSSFETSTMCAPVPTIDGDFIDKSPAELMRTGDFKRAPAMVGRTSGEAYGLLPFLLGEQFFSQLPDVKLSGPTLNALLEAVVKRSEQKNATVRDLKRLYESVIKLPDDNDTSSDAGRTRWSFVAAIISDSFFNKPLSALIAGYARQKIPVFQYEFDHVPSVPHNGVAVGKMFAGHFDDVPFWFGAPLDPKYGHTKAEQELSRKMMRALGNFAKTGNPNVGFSPNDKNTNTWWLPVMNDAGNPYVFNTLK